MPEGSSSAATYIRRDECIRISPKTGKIDSSGLTASIVGVGAENELSSFDPACKFLVGQIEEIKILDREMNTVAVHTSSSQSGDSKPSEQKMNDLLKKRLDLENRHNNQYEALAKKHHEERHQVEHHPNFSEEEMEYILTNVMGPLHERQIRMMRERHQKEQNLLMDVLFKL